jgi:hypothetical protein
VLVDQLGHERRRGAELTRETPFVFPGADLFREEYRRAAFTAGGATGALAQAKGNP